MSGGRPGYTRLLTGGPQVDAGSHRLHPGAILFQHLPGQGGEPGVAAVHGGVGALVEAAAPGGDGQTSFHITPRVLDPGGPASGGYSHPVPTGTRMGLTTLWKTSPNNSRDLLLLFCYAFSAWTPGLPVTSLWLAVSGFPFSVMLPTPAR